MAAFDWPPMLRTDRLLLRSPEVADAEALFDAYAADPRVTRYLTWKPNRSVDEVRAFLAATLERVAADAERHWVIERDGEMLGMVSLRLDRHMAELGYVLAYDCWGQGLMPEAAGTVVETAKANPGIYRLWAYHDVDNPASGRVLAKLGLEPEGCLRRWTIHPNVSDTPRDVEIYSWVR